VENLTKEQLLAGAVLNINKPFGWTSFDVVKLITAKYRCKAGHAGTLDPMATGVLIVCTQNKTKEIEKIQATKKEYIATIHLGITRPSFDIETPVTEYAPIIEIPEEELKKTLPLFIGKQEQIPPLFSAKKINGKPVYQLAREGLQKELKPAEVEVFTIELISSCINTLTADKLNGISILNFKKNLSENPINPLCTLAINNCTVQEITVRLTTSKGFYVRSFARDLALKLNTIGTLNALVRTQVGSYDITNAITII